MIRREQIMEVGEDQPAERARAKALWARGCFPSWAHNMSGQCSGTPGVRRGWLRGTWKPMVSVGLGYVTGWER